MVNVTDISELASLVCQKLIEYGVQPHTAWQDYSFNYRPILYFFQDHDCSQYNAELLGRLKLNNSYSKHLWTISNAVGNA